MALAVATAPPLPSHVEQRLVEIIRTANATISIERARELLPAHKRAAVDAILAAEEGREAA